ncbi:MAG: OmpA family protein, partial [Alphaproteobacteria bacterium]|nr:OmpA family protein [Alphaproteobacteria bacterium]
LLITFFVLLYSMKTVDESRWDDLRGAFSGVFAQEESLVMIHPEEFTTTESLPDFPADSLPYLQNVLRSEFRHDEILNKMESDYDNRKDILTLSLPSTLLFEAGEIGLKREGRLSVIKLADKLQHLDNRLQVAGHTDPAPFSSVEAPTNWEFAMLRAIAVTQVMYERGVSKSVSAFSFGDSRFNEIDSYLPETQRYSKARRIDILIYGDRSEL